MLLETPRLTVRPASPEDAKALTRIQNTDFVRRYNGMDLWDEAQTAAILRKNAGRCFVLCLKASGEVIGELGIEEDGLRWQANAKMLDYYLDEAHARRGYMTEALSAVLAHLFRDEGLDVVSARVFAPNRASRRLLEGLGFRLDGVLRHCVKGGFDGVIYDDAVYSMLKEEYFERYGRA